MKILGIDPSFTRTGICLKSGPSYNFKSISVSDRSAYEIAETMRMSKNLAVKIGFLITKYEPEVVIVEYPILATRSGAYLGLIQQAIYDHLFVIGFKGDYILVPAGACNSVTRNTAKTKTHIITWFKAESGVDKKINHDEATAGVMTVLGRKILNNSYKNSYNIIKFT